MRSAAGLGLGVVAEPDGLAESVAIPEFIK